jgi:uncharacterized protein YecT (DUF1311 family)
MGQQRELSQAAGLKIRSRLVKGAIYATLAGALAACGGSAGSTGSGSAGAAHSTVSASATPSGRATAAAATGFVPIVEPFDPGHPARTRPASARCDQTSTLAIEKCFETRTENTDAAINAVQLGHYQSGSQAQRAAILADDSGWLSARQPVCAKAFQRGGTMDEINVVSCLLDESTARLNAVKGITPPEAVLKATDSIDPADQSWYTTPEGSRISMVSAQGDNHGGAIIAWTIIAGAHGFLVNPAQFYFGDGSFIDHGTPEAPSPSGHQVAPRAEYQFGIDYTHLTADPGATKGKGAFLYVPGTPVASWGQ